MPQVPYVASPSVLPTHLNPVYQRFDVSARNFGGDIGEALKYVGQQTGRLGEVIAANSLKLSNERATADANNAWLSANIEAGKLNADYFSKEGINATDALPDYYKQMEEIRQRHLAKLGSEKAKALFDNDFTRSMVGDVNAGARWAASQHKVYVSGQSDARVQTAINDSAAKFGDEGAFNENLGVIGREMKNKASTEGWSQEKLDFETGKAEGMAYAARIREMAIYDPYTADRLFKENMGKLDPDAVPIIENAIRTSQLTVGVKQGVGLVFGSGDTARPSLIQGMMSLEKYKTDPTADLVHVSRGLQDAMARGMTHMPPGVGLQVTEGYTPYGHAPHSKHKIPGVGAIDYTLTLNGKPIPNSGPDTTGLYGRFSQFTLMELKANHPELVQHYRYGGTFETSKGSGRADLGHMDVGGRGGPRVGAGKIEGGPTGFLGRIIGVESSGRGGQVSSAGAVGLMQILPDTAKRAAREMGIPYSYEHLLNDNSYNVMIGKHIVNRLLQKYGGNEMLVAAAYNAGEGRVDPLLKGGVPHTAEEVQAFISRLPQETQNYVRKVADSPGVGYDPAPGMVHYTQSANSGTGVTGLPWSVRQSQLAAYADQVAPGDDVFLERLLSAGRTRYNIENQAKIEEQQAAYDLVAETAIKTGAKSEEELTGTSREVKDALAKLEGEKQITIHNLLEANSKDDIPETTEMLRKYDELSGTIKGADTEEARKAVDIYKEPMSRRLLQQLIDQKNAQIPPRVAAQNKINLTRATSVLEPVMSAAGIIKPPPGKTDDAAVKARADYAAFYGALSAELDRFAVDNKREPTDDEIRKIGSDLLLKMPAEKPGFWGHSEVGVPLFIMDKQQLQTYLDISPSAAEVVMETEIPDDVQGLITRNYVRKFGSAPSMEVIWQVYQENKLRELREKRK